MPLTIDRNRAILHTPVVDFDLSCRLEVGWWQASMLLDIGWRKVLVDTPTHTWLVLVDQPELVAVSLNHPRDSPLAARTLQHQRL